VDRPAFQALMEEKFQEILDLNLSKGHDYAGETDALANFKKAAERLGLTPEQVWAVYGDKHWSAIMTYCREGQVESEPIAGRIIDVILYGFLLLGLIEEKKIRDEQLAREGQVGA
jgi:hypothetical protein